MRAEPAPTPTGAPPWSPIRAAARPPGLSALPVAVLVAAGIGVAAAVALLLAPPSGTDLTAQQARAAFAAAHPGAAVDFRWYGGVLPAAYSVLTPYVAAVVGARLTGILAAAAGAPLLAMLLLRWRVRRPVAAAAWGALALAADMVSARTAFSLGLTLAIGALVAVPRRDARRRRWLPPTVLAVLAALASPVAALFLGLVALAWALVHRGVALLAVAAAVPLALVALLFPEPGRMPDTWAVARPVLLASLAVVVLCRGLPVRAAAAVYAAGTFIVFELPGPIGSNVERLALLFTGAVLLATSWLPRLLLAVAVAVTAQWTARVPLADIQHAHRLSVERSAAHRLVDALRGLGPIEGRIEVVPFADHGEAAVVAQAWPLARGWERQVDVVRARPLYSSRLDAAGYRSWLDRADVEYVALGRHAHDWSARSELRLLRQPPTWLRVVHRDAEWTVWQVSGFHPIVAGGGAAIAVEPDRLVISATTGVVEVGVRWSRWLAVSSGACVRRTRDGRTQLVVRRPGLVTLSSSYAAPVRGHHC